MGELIVDYEQSIASEFFTQSIWSFYYFSQFLESLLVTDVAFRAYRFIPHVGIQNLWIELEKNSLWLIKIVPYM